MTRLLLASSIALLLGACASQSHAPRAHNGADTSMQAAAASADARFADLSARWLEGYLKASPVGATQIGDHRFDSELDDLSAEGRAQNLAFSRSVLAELERVDRTTLSRENQVDYSILHNQLKSDVWNAETFQGWAWDPLIYSQVAGGALNTVLSREFAPLPDRLRSATARMEKLPGLYLQMRANLDPARVPRINAETASKQNKGVLSLVDEMITPHLGELTAADRQRTEAAIAGLRKAVDENQTWIDRSLVPNAKGEFRIGAAKYDAKLAFALDSPLSRKDIRERAQAALTSTRAEMYAIARTVLAGKMKLPPLEKASAAQQQAGIQKALDRAYAQRPARDKVVASAEKSLAEATEFVRTKNLVGMPDAPVKIIPMPEFARGVALAYCDSPGPLDKNLATFYAVSPIPEDWTRKQVDSYLREYNTRSIAELTVHEAMPGHYLQLWHSNKYPSVLRAVLQSGSFIEGWAVYGEEMMVDEGFLDNDPLYRLIHLKWNLRVIANAIIDQAIQVDGMTRAQAMQLMTVQTFQQEREASAKWVRAQLTAAQLPTYFVGWQEHRDLRAAAETRAAGSFDLRAYHDRVLSFGSPPVRYVRELMFDEPIE